MSSRVAGFTLLEVIVALSLAAFLALALAGGLRTGARAWETQERLLAGEAEVEPVARLLQTVLGGARRLDGWPTGFVVIARMPAALELAEPQEIRISQGAGGRLALGWRAYRRMPLVDVPYEEVVLLETPAALEIAYFGDSLASDAGGEVESVAAWQPVWQDRSDPPRLVRVRLLLAAAGGPHVVEIVAAPQLAAPARGR